MTGKQQEYLATILPSSLTTALLAISLFAFVTGCAFDKSYRPYGDKPHSEACFTDCKITGKEPSCVSDCKGTFPAEFRRYKNYDTRTGETVAGEYIAGYVEFDDQGWFHDVNQRKALFDAFVRDRGQDPTRQYLIVVYAHGWKHNANSEDHDVKQFNRLLQRLDAQEQQLVAIGEKKKKRKVVGVYLGWRGASLKVPLLQELTFWTRKNAGERVGDRSAKQLLMELNELRANLNNWDHSDRLAGPEESQLILIGHSFGGLVMYHALETEVMDRNIDLARGTNAYSYGTAKSFGDFIVLVNPAFEGSAYQPLAAAAASRPYPSHERPAMAIVTSKSDRATKYYFPLGRLYTVTQSAPHEGERETVMHTVGHLDCYITHDLEYTPSEGETNEETEISPATKREAEQEVTAIASKQPVDAKGRERYGDVTINPRNMNLPHGYPYLVMSADKKIIKDHSDIWNDVFVKFMMEFVTKKVMQPAAKPSSEYPKIFEFWNARKMIE